jgi:hypothetical protein
VTDELKRLVELAERQEQRELARTRSWRSYRWLALVVLLIIIAVSIWVQEIRRHEAERIAEIWRQRADTMLHDLEQQAKGGHP